jgi:alpha-glucoside transport system permease protein
VIGTLVRALGFIVIGVGGAAFFFYAGNLITERLMPKRAGDSVRPYIFVFPALFVVTLYLLYPLLDTFRQSLYADRFVAGERPFVGLENYRNAIAGGGTPPIAWILGVAILLIAATVLTTRNMGPLDRRRGRFRTIGFGLVGLVIAGAFVVNLVTDSSLTGNSPFWSAIYNNVLWIIFVPAGSVAVGLLVAVLADRMSPKAESLAKSMIFMPMAISFVGASVVWTLVYDISTTGDQIGLLNGILVGFGAEPVAWLEERAINDFALMIIMVWLQAGFAMVLLSAAIKSVPEDTLEAARIDGATEMQIFWRVVVPQITSTIVVVLTTILILVLKVFDIVAVLTNGRNDTQVVANLFYTQFQLGSYGSAGVLVMVLVVATIPFMVINVKRFREQEAAR